MEIVATILLIIFAWSAMAAPEELGEWMGKIVKGFNRGRGL